MVRVLESTRIVIEGNVVCRLRFEPCTCLMQVESATVTPDSSFQASSSQLSDKFSHPNIPYSVGWQWRCDVTRPLICTVLLGVNKFDVITEWTQ